MSALGAIPSPLPSPGVPGEGVKRFAGPALIAITFAAMLIWTWGGWADAVGNGRELYVPWRIAHGQVLYRDLPHAAGPFSQYFNGLLFRALGTSARTLILSNLLWLTALVAIVYFLWNLIAD